MSSNINKKVIGLLTSAIALLGGSAKSAKVEKPELPTPSDIDDLDAEEVGTLTAAFGISTEGKKPSAAKALLLTASRLFHDEDADEVDEAAAKLLCVAAGIAPGKKLSATKTALTEYLQGADGGEESADAEEGSEEEGEEEEKPKKKKKAEAEEEEGDGEEEGEEAEEDADEEAPKKKKKKDAEEEEEGEEESSEDGEEAEGEEDLDDDTKKERLDAYNEAAGEEDQITIKKGAIGKAYAQLEEKLKNSDDEVAEWGKPYVVDVEGEAEVYCCGLPAEEAKPKGAPKGTYCACAVTKKVFTVASDGSKFTPYKAK